jgi:hypothetical protein
MKFRKNMEGNSVFNLVFIVEFEVRYNLFMHKTQPQKLLLLFFLTFLIDSTYKTPSPPKNKHPPLISRGKKWELPSLDNKSMP